MYSPILKVKLAFLVIFFIGCAGLWAYQIVYVWPSKRCEAGGGWWAREWKTCAMPVAITTLTGRPIGSAAVDKKPAAKAQPAVPASKSH